MFFDDCLLFAIASFVTFFLGVLFYLRCCIEAVKALNPVESGRLQRPHLDFFRSKPIQYLTRAALGSLAESAEMRGRGK